MSSSHCASKVESGGVFFRMGPASSTIVWTGLVGVGAESTIASAGGSLIVAIEAEEIHLCRLSSRGLINEAEGNFSSGGLCGLILSGEV